MNSYLESITSRDDIGEELLGLQMNVSAQTRLAGGRKRQRGGGQDENSRLAGAPAGRKGHRSRDLFGD